MKEISLKKKLMLRKISLITTLLFCSNLLLAQIDKLQKDTLNSISKNIEKDAEFPGGYAEWIRFLSKNLNPNVARKKGAPAGSYTVVIRFIIGKEGKVEDITPETNYGYGMEEEVIRVIKKASKWMPATLNGKPLRAYRRQPVTFVVEKK